jgi:hypothetical protein
MSLRPLLGRRRALWQLIGDRNHQLCAASTFSHATNTTSSAPSERPGWVPEAYRGVQRTPNVPNFRGKKPTVHIGGRRDPEFFKQLREQKRVAKLAEQLDEIVDQQKNVLRLLSQYQSHFQQSSHVERPSPSNGKSSLTMKAKIKYMAMKTAEISDYTSSIHQLQFLMEWETINKTEDHYRGLCRALRKLIELTVSVGKNDLLEHNHQFIALAETGLTSLIKICSERTSLIESLQSMENASTPHRSASASESAWRPPGVFRMIVNRIFGIDSTKASDHDQQEQHSKEETPVYEDPSRHVTYELVRSVVNLMRAVVVEKSGISPSTIDSNRFAVATEQQEELECMAQRISALLERLPWSPQTDILETLLDVRSRIGTLESARACREAYMQFPNKKCQQAFALVLQAYLGAVVGVEEDNDKEIRVLAAQEALKVLNEHWNDNLPRNQVERVLHASIVLNCICVADRLSDTPAPHLCLGADGLIKRTLGWNVYTRLMKGIETSSASVDSLSLPLINYLTQLYANSGDEEKLVFAKKGLSVVMMHDQVAVGRMLYFPVVDTINSVLTAITRQYDSNKSKTERKHLNAEEDLEYAGSLMVDMLSRRQGGFWPNGETFDIVFRLLLSVKPRNVGEQAEDLLSKMEVRRSFSGANPVTITLSTYHRVLRCWLESAKVEPGHKACEQAMRVLDKLESQSYPLLLSDREARTEPASPLYNIVLRPTRQTYQLVLQICVETKNDDGAAGALEVASRAYERMEKGGIVPDKDAAKKLAQCRNRLTRRVSVKSKSSVSDETLKMLSNSDK